MSSLQIFQRAEVTLKQGILPPKRNERKKWMDIIEKNVKGLEVHKENHTWLLRGTWDEVQAAREILISLHCERKSNIVPKNEHVVHMKLEENFLPDRFPVHNENTPMKISAIDQKETINLTQNTDYSDRRVFPTTENYKLSTEFRSSKKSPASPVEQSPNSTEPLFKMPNGTTIYLYNSNITRLAVDVIVNAANESLLHHGGVAKAISKAGGPLFQRDSDEYINKHGKIPVSGTAVIAVGPELPYSHVINAVGPMWIQYSDKVKCRETLMLAFFNSFKCANEKLLALTMAVPPIGGGKSVQYHFRLFRKLFYPSPARNFIT